MEENKKEQVVVEMYPVKVGRRVLAFLADIFINLIVSIILFELVIFQISRPIIHFDDLVNENETHQKHIYDILYENNLLYFIEEGKENTNKYVLSAALTDTNYYYVSFLIDPNNEELKKYDVFNNYFVNLKENNNIVENLNTLLLNFGSTYFDENKFTVNGTLSLKDKYIDEFKHNYIEGDEMSIKGYEDFNNFRDDVFLKLFNEMFNDIEKNNLKSPDGSKDYQDLRGKIDNIDKTLNNNYIICSYVSFFVSTMGLFLFIPLFTEKRNTLGEKILKLERINKNTMEYLKRPMVLNIYLLKMMDSLCLLFLVPVLRLGFAYTFSLPILYLPALIGIFIALVNLGITMFTKLNTSLKELSTDSVVVSVDSLNNYYEEMYK